MQFKRKLLVATISVLASNAYANWTASGAIKNETAAFTKAGSTVSARGKDTYGAGSVILTDQAPSHKSGINTVFKSETSARIFINGEFNDGSSAHLELRPVANPVAVKENAYNDSYTQRDYFREAYYDFTTSDGTAVRIGKQQIVWGKADGAKFMDMINPTDYTEMAQNTMDESRIPTWAINAEKILDNGTTIQAAIVQPKENIFAGLNRGIDTKVRSVNVMTFEDITLNDGTDTNHPFMLLGPDSITGQFNGFLNIAPDLGGVARRFAWGFGGIGELSAPNMAGFTLDGFEAMTMEQMAEAMNGNSMLCATNGACSVSDGVVNANFSVDTTDAATIKATTDYLDLPDNFESAVLGVATALHIDPNAVTGAQMLAYGFQPYYNTNLANLTSAQDSAFDYMGSANFRTFNTFVNAKSQYVFNMPNDLDADFAFKLSDTLNNGLNYSVGYTYAYDKNPIIDLSWRNDNGQELTQIIDGYNTITLHDNDVNLYGGATNRPATLRFEQSLARTHNLAAGLDYSIDFESSPVVIRAEGVYTKNAKQPVIDKGRLAIGDLINGLTMQDQDRFKYVLGADVTVLTDMMASVQFIQERNLDFIDTDGYSGVSGSKKYTTDYATMHLSNGFQKAIENKEFYSIFLSKPFGESGEGRWNNILMLEEGGGRWNRFDVEYSISSDLIGTFELNNYWGERNTQFGQLESSSNLQLGLKYLIE